VRRYWLTASAQRVLPHPLLPDYAREWVLQRVKYLRRVPSEGTYGLYHTHVGSGTFGVYLAEGTVPAGTALAAGYSWRRRAIERVRYLAEGTLGDRHRAGTLRRVPTEG
jgi:hypothetical protein